MVSQINNNQFLSLLFNYFMVFYWPFKKAKFHGVQPFRATGTVLGFIKAND